MSKPKVKLSVPASGSPRVTGKRAEGELEAARRSPRMAEALKLAFVQGAKWWEFRTVGATMWQSDQETAYEVAKVRLKNGTLGAPPRAGNDKLSDSAATGAPDTNL